MTLTYVTTGAWGSGKGSQLTAAEADANFWDLDQRIAELETYPTEAVSITGASVSGNELTLILSDGSTIGPLPLPSGRGFFVEATERTTAQAAAGSDQARLIRMNSASALAFTLPLNATTELPVGLQFKVARLGAGAVTLTPGTAGVSILHPAVATDGTLAIPNQYQVATITKIDTDDWLVELSS